MPEQTSRRILCLPGFAQNKDVFHSATLCLSQGLNPHGIELEILPALHPCWNSGGATQAWCQSVPGQETLKFDQITKSIEYILKHIHDNGPYACILGFSQGGCMVGILSYLLDNKCEHLASFPNILNLPGPEESAHRKDPYKFICIGSYLSEDFISFITGKQLDSLSVSITPAIKSLHVIGTNDTIVLPERSSKFALAFKDRKVFKHRGGHFVPYSSEFISVVVGFVTQES
ncbi:dihydrofolate reductase [Entomophthora muscae]|uniref:Dihydrofolate reductase n=1 Tax=Entomophthora muscae TaxID=34485 RepID=A0ACC2SWK8_9FUNG|nr:dihydrofolate reductase [Entomophthora muscae]